MDANDALIARVREEAAKIIEHYKAAVQDNNWTVAEIWNIATSAIASLMRIVEEAGSFSGADKKAAVLLLLGDFYDKVIAPLDIPNIPEFIESRVVDPALKAMFLKLAEGMVDSLTNIFNRTGWYDVPAGVNNANGGIRSREFTPPSGFTPY